MRKTFLLLLLLTGCASKKPCDLKSLLDLHNAERVKHHMVELSQNSYLDGKAQEHADWMEKHRSLTHSDLNRINFNIVGENIANGQTTEPEVFDDWMRSRGHRNNILNKRFSQIGTGRSGNYWCVVFAGD